MAAVPIAIGAIIFAPVYVPLALLCIWPESPGQQVWKHPVPCADKGYRLGGYSEEFSEYMDTRRGRYNSPGRDELHQRILAWKDANPDWQLHASKPIPPDTLTIFSSAERKYIKS